ncbi:MAG TPA: serine/threonine-protein kinase [Burkholderiales bacterium]
MFELVERIGKYEIVKELGRGATSQVYLGHDPFADRKVAIKVFQLGESGGDETARNMQRKGFLAEAALVGKLTHPHIVEIYDAATEGDTSYVVMEYVSGGALDRHADPATLLPTGKVVEIVFKCVRALEMAMREGIIHRDIKPGNILLTDDGDIKISDFGAAIRAANTSDTTRDMSETVEGIVGSPGYMSPEQVRNETLTHQSDIFSLGVVMYRLLTGRLPLTATNQMSMAYAILNTEPPPPSSLRLNLPEVLDRITMKAMAKDRARRYQNWMEFGRDLTQAFAQLRAEGEAASESQQFEALRALPFFADFDDVELWEVIRISSWSEFKTGDVVIHEGTDGDALFVLVGGEVDVSLRGQRVSTIKRGGIFGEILYFADQAAKRSTTITARNECDVIQIKAAAIRAASDGVQAEFNKASMRVLIERLTQMNARLAMMKAAEE